MKLLKSDSGNIIVFRSLGEFLYGWVPPLYRQIGTWEWWDAITALMLIFSIVTIIWPKAGVIGAILLLIFLTRYMIGVPLTVLVDPKGAPMRPEKKEQLEFIIKLAKQIGIALGFLLFIAWHAPAMAADLSSEAYCQYDQQKAEAERLLDQSPMFMAGLGRNNSATNNVLAIGVTESLSKYLQGNLSHKIGDADCHLYQVTSEIQKHVSYDLQVLQLEMTRERVKYTEAGIRILDGFIKEEQQRQMVGTSTLQNVATLQAARETLVVSKAQLDQQIATIVLPEQDSHERLNELLSLAQTYLLDEQHQMAKQQSLQNWDVSITVGEGSNPNLPMLHSLPNETFATAQFTYSFGATKRTRALEGAANAYTASQVTAINSPINLAYLLKTQVTRAKEAAKASQTAYEAYAATIQQQLASVVNIDTSLARAFRIQLWVADINNNIELASAKQNEYYMTQYLTRNFDEGQN